MTRLTLLTLTAVAILALVALGLSMAGPNATAASRPARAYLPAVVCEDCAGRATPPPQPSPSATPSPSVYAARMIELVNQARAAVDCPAVTSHDALMLGTQAWSEKMAREGFYGHSPGGYYEGFGYPTGTRVENIGTGETPEYTLEGWMQSPSHKRNLEWCYLPGDPSYDPAMLYDVGVGYAWPGYWILTIGNHMP